MSTREAYKQRIEAELELARTKLAEFKAQPISLTATERAAHIKRIEGLEHRVAASREQLKELDDAHEDVWHKLKVGIEGTWIELQNEVEDAISKK